MWTMIAIAELRPAIPARMITLGSEKALGSPLSATDSSHAGLEVGCGTGHLASVEFCQRGGRVVVCTLRKTCWAKRRPKRRAQTLVRGALSRLPLARAYSERVFYINAFIIVGTNSKPCGGKGVLLRAAGRS